MESIITAEQGKERVQALQKNIARVIRGKDDVIRMAVVGFMAGGHILFEDVPGLGKTTLAQALAQSVNLSFQRIQGTSDLLPSDILGVTVFDSEKNAFKFKPGPLFAHIVLFDEINRTTPKTQSALLEAMNTGQVSIDRMTYALPQPFMVIATQNPVESQGTFPLPKSQLDRFMMRLRLGYPDAKHEQEILKEGRRPGDFSMIRPVLTADDVLAMQAGVRRVKVDDSLLDYMVRLVHATRHSPLVELGGSTRGTITLKNCAQACAYVHGRDFCLPDDVKSIAVAVLAHRLGIVRTFEETAEKVGEGSAVVTTILEEVGVPI